MGFRHLADLDTYDTYSALKHLKGTWEELRYSGDLGT